MAVHHDTPLLINTSQFAINMPGTGLPLSDVYARLFLPASASLNLHGSTDEDAFLLLVGLWSDIVHVQQLSFENLDTGTKRGQNLPRYCDPFAPLSPAVEEARLRDRLSAALSTWHADFAATVPDEMTALWYYCKMVLQSPQILELSSQAGYVLQGAPQHDETNKTSRMPTVNDETSNLAMLVLDHASARNSDTGPRVEIWLPVIVFHAGLAVWANSHSKQLRNDRPVRMLSSFIRVLDWLPWPCCEEMATTLKSL